jgi:hypothetical protein
MASSLWLLCSLQLCHLGPSVQRGLLLGAAAFHDAERAWPILGAFFSEVRGIVVESVALQHHWHQWRSKQVCS